MIFCYGGKAKTKANNDVTLKSSLNNVQALSHIGILILYAGGDFLTEAERAELVDINTVHVDPTLPPAERAAQYIAQIKNPDCFLCNGVVVHLQFDPQGGDLKSHLKNYFIACKQD